MAFSEKLSDIIVLDECEVYSTKSQYSVCISLNLSKKGHNSVKTLQITSKFKFDLYIVMVYPSVKLDPFKSFLIGNHNL